MIEFTFILLDEHQDIFFILLERYDGIICPQRNIDILISEMENMMERLTRKENSEAFYL